MFIALDVHKNIPQPCRGGTGLRWVIHAAPMGLGRIMGWHGSYNHGALTELGLERLPRSSQSVYPQAAKDARPNDKERHSCPLGNYRTIEPTGMSALLTVPSVRL